MRSGLFLGTTAPAETAAVREACSLFQSSLEQDASLLNAVTIYSDSQSMLLALSKRQTTSRCIKECKAALNLIGDFASVRLRWVKGHSRESGNEEGDSL